MKTYAQHVWMDTHGNIVMFLPTRSFTYYRRFFALAIAMGKLTYLGPL